MKKLRNTTGILTLTLAAWGTHGQDLAVVNQQWHQTVVAVRHGDAAEAKADFARFNTAVRSYVSVHGLDWQVEYLAGSLDCLFPDTKKIGAEYLGDILQNSRSLNSEGYAELQRQLISCQSSAPAISAVAEPTIPENMTEASTHYQSTGIHGDMKGGGMIRVDQESSVAVSPVAAADLLAQRTSLNDPKKALEHALSRLPEGSKGSVIGEFVVTTENGPEAEAEAVGRCLQNYAKPLGGEFQMDSPEFMVTAFTVPETQVYSYARRLHGLQLPLGVIAYSVPEDMSLVSPGSGTSCGSMAHELVHLLIKRRFPGAPAWLEEGIASEAAIAVPTPTKLVFGWSWRDEALRNTSYRPTVSRLLNFSWSDFNSNSIAHARSAEATQAMAAVFIRYLDAKNRLTDVYFSVRDQHLSPDLSRFTSYESILEEQLHMPVASIDADFQGWFTAQAGNRQPSHPSTNFPSSGGVPGEYINAPFSPRPASPCVNSPSPVQQAPDCAPANTPPPAPNEPPNLTPPN
jgi:hypothetical protein